MKKRAVIMGIVLLLTVWQAPAALAAETSAIAAAKAAAAAAKAAVEEAQTVEWPSELTFVDVFGDHYTTEILADVPKTAYRAEGFVREGDKLFYEDKEYTSRQGVDVSHHQGEIHWDVVKEAGYEFAFIRLGYRGYGEEGKLMLDNRFEENLAGAKAAGLDVGVYFFSQAVSEAEAEEEAKFVLDHLNGEKLDLPVVFDPENILDDEARTDDVPGEQFTKNTLAFCAKISEAGYEPMVYSNMLWEAFQFDMRTISQFPVWYADYEPIPQTPYAFRFLQYTNKAHVDGIGDEVDLDIEFIPKANGG